MRAGTPLQMDLSPTDGRVLPPNFAYAVDDDALTFSDKVIRTSAFKLEWIGEGRGYLRFSWPESFLAAGTLEILAGNHQVLWSQSIDAEDAKTEQPGVRVFESSSLGSSAERELLEARVFRFCFRQERKEFKISFCSAPMAARKRGDQHIFLTGKANKTPALSINGKPSTARGIVNFNTFDTRLVFSASLATGAQYQIESVPNSIEIVDAARTEDNRILLRGRKGPPHGAGIETLEGGEWQTVVPREGPKIVVFGTGEIPFIVPLMFFNDLPQERDRPVVASNSKRTTYLSSVKLQGKGPANTKVMTKQGAAKNAKKTGRFIWRLDKLEKGQMNRRTLVFKTETSELHSSYEIYRGYSYDVGLRMTGVLAGENNTTVMFGELAASKWFETAFGMKSHWLSDRRWGVAAKYFGNISAPEEAYKVTMMTADLKYRLSSGIWGLDESVGLLVGYQSFTYASSSAVGMLGVGAFWARSMPQFIDSIFNLVPWFRYPKWVDAEFVLYPISAGDVSMGTTYKLGFHGKMNLTPAFYVEGGFGLYNYAYNNKSLNTDVEFAMSYGTVGAGVSF